MLRIIDFQLSTFLDKGTTTNGSAQFGWSFGFELSTNKLILPNGSTGLLAKSLDFCQAELDRQDELDAVEPTVEAAATDILARF